MKNKALFIFRTLSNVFVALVVMTLCSYGRLTDDARADEDKPCQMHSVRLEMVVEHVSPETHKKTAVFRRTGASAIVYFSGMAIDADGAPNDYHPDDVSGLDALEHAGDGKEWWALVTDDNDKPVIQQSGEFKGFYVSMTWLHREDDSYSENEPSYWVDARTVPYVAVPKTVWQATGVHKGDLAYVFNAKTGKASFAIVADWGTEDTLGEGSIALAEALGVESSPRTGGQDNGVTYVVFPDTAARPAWPRALEDMSARAEHLLCDWGGREAIKKMGSIAPRPTR
jgi:hypothetical protein